MLTLCRGPLFLLALASVTSCGAEGGEDSSVASSSAAATTAGDAPTGAATASVETGVERSAMTLAALESLKTAELDRMLTELIARHGTLYHDMPAAQRALFDDLMRARAFRLGKRSPEQRIAFDPTADRGASASPDKMPPTGRAP